jgi:hypothetical protein
VQALSGQQTPDLAVREVALHGASLQQTSGTYHYCCLHVLLQYERLGFSTAKRPAGPVLWFHALSIGESAMCSPSVMVVQSVQLSTATGSSTSREQQRQADNSAGSSQESTMVLSVYGGSRVCALAGTAGNSRPALSGCARLMQQTWRWLVHRCSC